MNFKDKTAKLRLKLSLKIVKTLTPTIYKWVNDTVNNAHGIPRPFTLNLKNQYNLVGAEIGFGFGINAENLLNELSIKKLYCIDPYFGKKYMQNEREISSYTDNKKSRLNKLKRNKKVVFIECNSHEATQHITEPLDFVYIDGNHTYQYVLNDLTTYYKLVKPYGYIGGHDYIFGQDGVISAVQDFAIQIKQPPQIRFPDFWFTKQNG